MLIFFIFLTPVKKYIKFHGLIHQKDQKSNLVVLTFHNCIRPCFILTGKYDSAQKEPANAHLLDWIITVLLDRIIRLNFSILSNLQHGGLTYDKWLGQDNVH